MAQLAFQTHQQYGENRDTLFRGVGQEAKYLKKQSANAYINLTYLMSRQSDLHKFCNLAMTWKEETKLLSFVSSIAQDPAYLEIIGMGKKVLPYILQDLKFKPSHWFVALRAITGISPIKSPDRGNIVKMAEDWLTWGRENGYI